MVGPRGQAVGAHWPPQQVPVDNQLENFSMALSKPVSWRPRGNGRHRRQRATCGMSETEVLAGVQSSTRTVFGQWPLSSCLSSDEAWCASNIAQRYRSFFCFEGADRCGKV